MAASWHGYFREPQGDQYELEGRVTRLQRLRHRYVPLAHLQVGVAYSQL